MNGHAQHRLLITAVAVSILIVIVTTVATAWYAASVAGDRRAEQVAGCNRANVQRHYINHIILHLEMNLEPIVIPDCESIVR